MKEKIKNINCNELMNISDILWVDSIADFQKQIYERKKHCIKVSRISMDLFKYFLKNKTLLVNEELISEKNEKYLKKILYFSSLTHDIRKFEEDHHIKSAEYVCSELEYDISEKDLKNINILISAHNSKEDISFIDNVEKVDEDEMKLLIIIIRLADKISKADNKKDIEKKFEKVIKQSSTFIYEILDEEELNNLKEFIKEKYC